MTTDGPKNASRLRGDGVPGAGTGSTVVTDTSGRSAPRAGTPPSSSRPEYDPEDPGAQFTDQERDPTGPACPSCRDPLLKVARFRRERDGSITDENPRARFWCQRESVFYTRRGKRLDDPQEEPDA